MKKIMILSLLSVIASGVLAMKQTSAGQPPLTVEQKNLYTAIAEGNEKVIDDYITSRGNLNIVNRDHATPLFNAIYFNRQSIALKLLNAGANPTIGHWDGITPLRRAILSNNHYHNLPIIKALLDKGMDVNEPDFLGNTPLHDAVAHGTPELVSFLIVRGADIYARNKVDQTPIKVAMQMQIFPDKKAIYEILKNAMRERQKKYTREWAERLHPES